MAIDRHALKATLTTDLHGAYQELSNLSRLPCGGLGWSSSAYAVCAMQESFMSKDRDSPLAEAEAEALKLFVAANNRCAEWKHPRDLSDEDDILLGTFRTSIDRVFNWGRHTWAPNLLSVLDRGDCGPGSAGGAYDESFYAKLFASPLHCTSQSLYEMYNHWVSRFPRWSNAEFHRSALLGKNVLVSGSKLSYAPKKRTVARTICVEPSLNMYYQLGVGSLLEDLIQKKYGIDFSSQQVVNRQLAKIGSINESFSTIDLKSASDSISLSMLEWCLPRHVFELLTALRSRTTTLPDGSEIELNMISSMGNGYTFALQTLLFSAMVESVYRLYLPGTKMSGGCGGRQATFSVYGDDIIVDSKVAKPLIRLLELLGFVVNTDKTFVEGPFRESCGTDFYVGANVRPVYFKTDSNDQALYSLINNLNKWTAMTGVILPNTVQFLLRHIKFKGLFVPLYESVGVGLRIPSYIIREQTGGFRPTYKRLVPRPVHWDIRDDRLTLYGRKHNRSLEFNPDGLLTSFLEGRVTNHKISLRAKSTKRYRLERLVSPCWDEPE